MAVTPLPVHGVDISHHQSGTLDLAGAKRRGLRWLYHKATEGTSLKDARYAQRRAEAAKAGLPFGAYHFARADRGDAVEEAKFFLAYAQPKPGDLRPALDLETMEGLSLAEIRRWAADFIAEVVRQTGHKPVVYTPFDLGSVDDGCIIWRPRYNNTNTPPKLAWDIFQFSNGVYGVPNRLRGIGNVDLNYMRDGLRLEDMLIPEPKPEPVPDLLFTIDHASQQWPDSDAQTASDIDKALAPGKPVVTFTEVSKNNGNLPILRRAARKHGYRVFFEGGEVAIAVKRGIEIIDSGATLVNPAQAGKPPTIGHSRRYALWVKIRYEGEVIFVVTAHWVTGFATDADRREKHEKMSREIVRLVRENGKGANLAFFSGDINAPDRKAPTPGYAILTAGGLTTCWDELGVWPSTHGRNGSTIDIIGSYDRDGRVSAESARVFRDGFSDHERIRAVYRIKRRRKRA